MARVDSPNPRALLVIGVHHEELAFGDQVAAGLDPAVVEVLRIPEGLSGRLPRPDELFYYETRHRELYHQLLNRVHGHYPMLLDLHCGLDEAGPSADLISRNAPLLACAQDRIAAQSSDVSPDFMVRSVLLDSAPGATLRGIAATGHTVIPREIWRNPAFDYVGIEVYLRARGAGEAPDWVFARELVQAMVDCQAIGEGDFFTES